jgi:hypothetical protein
VRYICFAGRSSSQNLRIARHSGATIFRVSENAPAGVEHGIVSASRSPSSYTVTMKPTWRVRIEPMKIINFGLDDHGWRFQRILKSDIACSRVAEYPQL